MQLGFAHRALESEQQAVVEVGRIVLFAGSDEGGDNWAVIATLIENCKLSGINPHTWLTQTLDKLANGHPANSVAELMPWIAVA